MKKLIEILKNDEIPCTNKNCKYYNTLFEQNCSGIDENGDPLIMKCNKYIPETFEYEEKNDG